MNVLDIDNETLETACSHARVNLMWHARQQTDPQKMVDYALAAAATDLYPAALTDMARNKVLASFELGLSEKARDFLISKEELNRGLLLDLHGFLSDTALAHAREYRSSVFDSLNDGHPTPNFGAVAVNCAEKTAGIDDYEAGRRAGELLKEQDSHAADHGGRDAVTVEYETSYGESFKLALYCDTYVDGGGLAVAALDATDPDSEDYMEPWSTLTVNVPDDPEAAASSAACYMAHSDLMRDSRRAADPIDAMTHACAAAFISQYPVCMRGHRLHAFLGAFERTAPRELRRELADVADGRPPSPAFVRALQGFLGPIALAHAEGELASLLVRAKDGYHDPDFITGALDAARRAAGIAKSTNQEEADNHVERGNRDGADGLCASF